MLFRGVAFGISGFCCSVTYKTVLRHGLLFVRTNKGNKKWIANPCLPVTRAGACNTSNVLFARIFLVFIFASNLLGEALVATFSTCTHPYYTVVYAQLRYFCDPFVHYACIQFISGNKNTVSGSFQVLKYTVLSL